MLSTMTVNQLRKATAPHGGNQVILFRERLSCNVISAQRRSIMSLRTCAEAATMNKGEANEAMD